MKVLRCAHCWESPMLDVHPWMLKVDYTCQVAPVSCDLVMTAIQGDRAMAMTFSVHVHLNVPSRERQRGDSLCLERGPV